MKVKLKKRKKSSALGTVEQAKIKGTIEILRKNAHTYVVPVQLFPDRGYRHIIDLADRMQKTKEKTPAPTSAKQTGSEIIVDSGRQFHYWLDECTKQVIKKAKENIEKIKAEIKAEKEPESPRSEFLTNNIDRRGHRAAKDSKTLNAFMTLEQKKQVTDALVSFVLRVTSDSHYIEQEETAILPAILDFLMKTDSPKGLEITLGDDMIGSLATPDLHKAVKKFAESKE